MTVVEYVIIALFVLSIVGSLVVQRVLRSHRLNAYFAPLTGDRTQHSAIQAAENFMSGLPVQAGPRVTVRPAEDGDGPGIFGGLDEEVAHWMGWTHEHVERRNEWAKASGQMLRVSGYMPVLCNDTGDVIGAASASSVDLKKRVGELGFWMGTEARGTGLGLEALQLALECLHDGGLETVRLHTAVNNKPMRRIAEQAGAVQAMEVEHTLPNGSVVDSVIYVHANGGNSASTDSASTAAASAAAPDPQR